MWERHFGFVQQLTGRPVIIGETGGTVYGLDAVWARAQIDYIVKKAFAGVFWFCARASRRCEQITPQPALRCAL